MPDPSRNNASTASLILDQAQIRRDAIVTPSATVADLQPTVVPTSTEADGADTNSATGTVAVTIAGADGVPTTAADFVSGDAPDGRSAVCASGVDACDALTYSLVNDAAGRFGIDPVTGVIMVKEPQHLACDAATSHMLVVRATDRQGAVIDRTILLPLADIIGAAPIRNVPGPGLASARCPGETATALPTRSRRRGLPGRAR